MGPRFQPIVHQILSLVDTMPGRIAVTLIGDDGSDETLTYRALHEEAMSVGRHLKASGVVEGDVVFITLPHSRGLITSLIASFYIGAVPAILPSELASPQRPLQLRQLKNLVNQANAKVIITSVDRVKPVADMLTKNSHRPSVITVSIQNGANYEILNEPDFWEGRPTYLQHTSGTTGLRKAAQISDGAIGTCVSEFSQRLGISRDSDVVVNWLPLHHDYGMFAGLMTPLLTGVPLVLMSPARCIRRPHTLFQAIHAHRGTLSWTTNSALSFFAKRTSADQIEACDLSGLRVLCAGGEPTTSHSMDLFAERFKPLGFDPKALMSGYGLAETTMGVTVCDPAARRVIDWVDMKSLHTKGIAAVRPAVASGAVSFVSNGTPLPGSEIRIVDKTGQPIPDRTVGLIQIQGKTVFDGYLGNQAATFLALKDGWLQTNDTGYFADDQLFVIGRADDRIIVSGTTIYPEALEAIATSIDGIASDKAVAFGVFDDDLGTEKIILVCDMASNADASHSYDLELKIRERCKQQLDISINEIVFVPKSWIVTTVNGKMPRRANRDKYLSEQPPALVRE
jgi:fatty-acyl-CoA synthase